MLLNAAPTVITSFTVSPVEDGNYMVKVVYDEGESDASNIVAIKGNMVENILVDSESGDIYDLNGYKVNQTEKGRIYIRNNRKIINH